MEQAQTEVDNIMRAITAGVITATTKAAMEAAEQRLEAAKVDFTAVKAWQPTQFLPRARETYRRMVEKLKQIEDVATARKSIRAIIGGEINLIPEGDDLIAEMTQAGLAGLCQISVVAGAGFEPATFGL